MKELAIQCVIRNIEALESLGDIPKEFSDRILSNCTPRQLLRIEKQSKRKDLNTEPFWKAHCKKIHRIDGPSSKLFPAYECTNWRELFFKKEEENEKKKTQFSKRAREIYKQEEKSKKAKQIQMIDKPLRPQRGSVSLKPSPQSKGRLMEKSAKQFKQMKSLGVFGKRR